MRALRASALADTAGMRHHVRIERDVPASADRMFEILSTGEGQTEWAEGYRRTTWLTDAPHGVGSVRDIHLQWISVRERFLVWEPGRRFAFSSDAMSIPLAKELVEDISFEPLGPDSTRMTWLVHFSPRGPLRPVSPVLAKRVFTPMFTTFADGLAGYAATHP